MKAASLRLAMLSVPMALMAAATVYASMPGDCHDARSLFELGRSLETGSDTTAPDSAAALLLITQAADSAYPPALNYLGFKYYMGHGVKRDTDKAIDLIEQAAMADDAMAASNLGWLLTEGTGVRHDLPKAAFWLRRATDQGNPAAMSQLADMYRLGRGLPADTAAAISLYEDSFNSGYAPAARTLAAMMGKKWQELPDDSLASLASRYYASRAPEIGVKLYESLSRRDSSSLRPIALMMLADAHSRALGTHYSYKTANSLIIEAAFAGDPTAEYIIAEQLEIFPDYLAAPELRHIPGADILDQPQAATAAFWYERAAEKGVTDARTANMRLSRHH